MNTLKKHSAKLKGAIIILCTLACAYLLLLPLIFDKPAVNEAPEKPLNGFVVYTDGLLEAENAALPYVIKNKDSRFIDMYMQIPESGFDVTALKFTLFLKNVWVYVDGELIYENVFKPTWYNEKSPGSASCITVLPYESAGKELHIRYEKIIANDSGSIMPISMINGAINTKTAHSGFSPLLLLMVSLGFISFVLMFIAVLYRKLKMNVRSLMCLALTVLCISCWSLCNSKMFEALTVNRAFTNNLEYISFYLLPLCFLAFMRRNWEGPSVILKLGVNIAFSFYALSLALRVLFNVDFYNLLSISHLLIILEVSVIIYEILINYKKRPSSFKYFCFGIGVFALSALAELFFYYSNKAYGTIAFAFMLGLGAMSVIMIFCYALSTKEQLDLQFAKIAKTNMDAEHSRYEMLISNTSDIFMDWQIENDSVYFSKQYEKFFGVSPFKSGFGQNIFHNSKADNYHLSTSLEGLYSRLMDGSPSENIEGWFIHPNGEKRWFEASLSCVFGADQKPVRVVGIIRDITKEQQLLEEFKNRNEFIKVNAELYDNVLEADITQDIVTGKNSETLAQSLSIPDSRCYSEIIKAISEQLTHDDFKEEYAEMLSRERILSLYENNTPYFTYECIERSDGVNYEWIRLTVCIYKSDITDTVRIISYVKNISQDKKREFELLSQSKTDSLSGVLNKGATKAEINKFLSESRSGRHAFIMLDADNFKAVNDSMGHIVGDSVIQELGRRFQEMFSESDIVGRIGGDEFAVLIKNVGSYEALNEMCAEILKKLKSTVSHNGSEITITMSMGVCVCPTYGETYEALYANADSALYRAKNSGRNCFYIYSGE